MSTSPAPSSAPDPHSAFSWIPVLAIGAMYVCRMLGLFMILPVFSPYAHTLAGHQPLLMGLAIGIYGLSQMLFQIPLGIASDRWGRKPVITAGLLVFGMGSLVAATSSHIMGVIAGRALQGAGAISGVLLALVADITPPAAHSRAMAMVGMSVGVSFMLALFIGPLLNPWIGVPGLFYATAGLSALCLLLLHTAIPTPPAIGQPVGSIVSGWHAWKQACAADRSLLPLYVSVLLLHALLTGFFVVLPLQLPPIVHPISLSQASFYAITVGIGCGAAGWWIARHRHHTDGAALQPVQPAIGCLAGGLLIVTLGPAVWWSWIVGCILFFVGFGYLEAQLPALLSGRLPAAVRGTGLSLFAMGQFFGAFCGGTGAGAWLAIQGPAAVWYALTGGTVLWYIAWRAYAPYALMRRL